MLFRLTSSRFYKRESLTDEHKLFNELLRQTFTKALLAGVLRVQKTEKISLDKRWVLVI